MDVFSLARLVHKLQPRATSATVAHLQDHFGALPGAYLGFLSLTNGAEFSNSTLVIWSVADVVELNDAYPFARYVPEFLAIGSDGGGSAVWFDRARSQNPEDWPVVCVDFSDLDRKEFVLISSNMATWAHDHCPITAAV
jgi:hypothetical protein